MSRFATKLKQQPTAGEDDDVNHEALQRQCHEPTAGEKTNKVNDVNAIMMDDEEVQFDHNKGLIRHHRK